MRRQSDRNKDSIRTEMKSLCVGVKVLRKACGSVYKVAFCTFSAFITCICGPSVGSPSLTSHSLSVYPSKEACE